MRYGDCAVTLPEGEAAHGPEVLTSRAWTTHPKNRRMALAYDQRSSEGQPSKFQESNKLSRGLLSVGDYQGNALIQTD